MKIKQQGHTISGVFIFLLLGIFATASVLMVLAGATVYSSSTDRTALHNEERIAASYIRSKLREADKDGMFAVEENSGTQILRMENADEGTVTFVYVWDGTLYEWYTLAQLADIQAIPANAAEAVCSLDEMQIVQENGLMTVKLRKGDEWTTVEHALRSVVKRGEIG